MDIASAKQPGKVEVLVGVLLDIRATLSSRTAAARFPEMPRKDDKLYKQLKLCIQQLVILHLNQIQGLFSLYPLSLPFLPA
ncbi:hypothetical protein A2U01_0035047 [Trifolium medium]|uniref:Uncharacterized protein n=1 Tax=Trifolium medium TaxID=97028 RepID=A0A392PQ14_9FABA|nr:hypothetical protein [Trifolium medium]